MFDEAINTSLHTTFIYSHILCAHCGSGAVIMLLVCHMISQDHMIKGSKGGWVPLIVSHTPANFGGHKDRGNGDIMVLVFHVIFT